MHHGRIALHTFIILCSTKKPLLNTYTIGWGKFVSAFLWPNTYELKNKRHAGLLCLFKKIYYCGMNGNNYLKSREGEPK
jgi:hypothetical protein